MMESIDKVCWSCLKSDHPVDPLMNNALRDQYFNIVGIESCLWNTTSPKLCRFCIKAIKKVNLFQASVKKSHSLLMNFQNQHYDGMIETRIISYNAGLFGIIVPPLSQSVIELWCTPEDDNNDFDFLTEDLDIKNEEWDVSDKKPLVNLESSNNFSSCTSVSELANTTISLEKLRPKDISKMTKVKKKKNKKVKKKNRSKSKRRSSSVVLKNRRVLETKEYKVIRLTPAQALEERDKTLKSVRYLDAPYKCNLCAKGFNYDDVLINHMTKHEKKHDCLECQICHQFLPSTISLRGHTKSHLVRYECRECGEIRASRQHLLEHHSLQHRVGNNTPRQYTCNICGKSMMKRTMFQKHVKLHAPTSRLPCDKCGKSFKTIETLRAHKLHHEDSSERRHAEVKRYKCPDCPKQFRYASLLYTHRVTHVTTRDFYCVECDLSFKTQSNLRLHLNKSQKHIDPETLKFLCNDCDKRFATEEQLKHHIDCIHMGKREFACSSCGRQYATKDGLRAHNRKEHPPPGVLPPPVVAKHICDICSRAFKAKAVLVKHLRTHTGERPFQCVECPRAFSQKSTLATHIKLVHRNKKLRLVKLDDKIFLDSIHANLEMNSAVK